MTGANRYARKASHDMGREDFGRYAEQRRKDLHHSRGFVATRLVMASGGDYFDTTSVRNIEEGKREITEDLYEWLIGILSMDRDEAHAALFGLPEGITVEDIRELRRTASERHAARLMAADRAALEGASSAAPASSSSDPEDLMRACAPSAGQSLPEAA